MSHSLLWRHVVLLTVGVYSSSVIYHWNQYDEEISKKKRVGPSVCPFVTLKKKPTPSLLLIVER